MIENNIKVGMGILKLKGTSGKVGRGGNSGLVKIPANKF